MRKQGTLLDIICNPKEKEKVMSAKLITDSNVGISCPDIGIIFDCLVRESNGRSATVVNAAEGALPVFDPGTILRIT